VRPLSILFLLFLFSCAGIQPLGERDWKKHYSETFLETVEKVIELRENNLWEEAIELVMSQDEENLSSSEKAFRRNLIGVHFLNNQSFEKSILYFTQANSYEIEDLRLIATVHLNLANANFQLGLFEQSLKSLSNIDNTFLGDEGKKNYYLLNYEIATYIDDKDLQFSSLIGFTQNFGSSSKIDYEEAIKAFEILIKGKSIDEQISVADKFLIKINSLSLGYVLDIIEKSYFAGKTDTAKNLLQDLESLAWVQSDALEKITKFKQRLGAFSEVDPKAIGVVLPLSGKYKKFGVRILRGIHSAFDDTLSKDGFRLIIEDSKSSTTIGLQSINKLIKKYKVSSIIGGIEPSSSTVYFNELKKYQVIFFSLAKVIAPREIKSRFLIEVSGSVESEVRSVLKRMSSQFPSSKAAVVYPENELGESYLNTFWELAKVYGVNIVDAVSFDPTKKDLRDPIRDLLGLKYKRERKEELEILKEVYSLEKSVIRRVQKLKPLIDFDWAFIPSAPYSAAQIIPSFSYFDATEQILVGPSSWKSAVVKEVSRGKKGVNFNYNDSGKLSDGKFLGSYGYSPKLPETRGRSSIEFLEKLLDGKDLSRVSSREELFGLINRENEVNLSSDLKYLIIDGTWHLNFELGHFRGGRVFQGLRYVEKKVENNSEEKKK